MMNEHVDVERHSRKAYQKALQKRRRRLRRRRQNRIRKIRMIRVFRTAKFWTRTAVAVATILFLAFWAKFAVVYNIPTYAKRGPLTGVQAYVTVKPWWFGPPTFNLAGYEQEVGDIQIRDPYAVLLLEVGRYDAVILSPRFVWVKYIP